MSFEVSETLEAEIDCIIVKYPQKRSASLMVLHALQDHFGHISNEAAEWAANKLCISPISIYELLTFYPMFRQKPVGKHLIKVCRTLSCALGGAKGLHAHFCKRLGLNAENDEMQTSSDGRFSIEWVECLAACGTAPVMMCDDVFFEKVSIEKADVILQKMAAGHGFEP